MGAQDSNGNLSESLLPGQNLRSVSGTWENDSLLSFHLAPWHETSALQTRAWGWGAMRVPVSLAFLASGRTSAIQAGSRLGMEAPVFSAAAD